MTLAIPRDNKRPVVWSIAGSDSGGGAGLQTDLKTLMAMGAHACTVVTSITAQNSAEVRGYESVSPAMLKTQIEALHDDLPPDAIKIGMLGNAEGVGVLAESLRNTKAFTVYDPVLVSSSGTQLLDEKTLAVMRERLLPLVDVLTPNAVEAEALSGMKIRNDEDAEAAARKLLATGAKAVVIKGIDSAVAVARSAEPLRASNAGAGFVQDFYSDGKLSFWLTLPKYAGEVPRGTGCAFASAFAAAHAFGYDNADAACIAKAYVHRLLRLNKKLGKGPPIAEHREWPPSADDFPWMSATAKTGCVRPLFPDCGDEPLGFYPIVDSADWLQRLLPLGVRTAQLRVKNLTGEALEKEIAAAVKLAKTNGTRLFINDFWQLAIKHGAYGVHLGQEDLEHANINSIASAGLRLGISTHSYAELARALSLRPSYIALGPVYPTTLKSMRFAPQGVETVHIWRHLTDLPLVAIGGIKMEQGDDIYSAGADSIAVVSDVTQAVDPEGRAKDWLHLAKMRKRPVHKGDFLTGFV